MVGELLESFEGVMIGRLIQNNPLLKKVDKKFFNSKEIVSIDEEIVCNYFEYIKPKFKKNQYLDYLVHYYKSFLVYLIVKPLSLKYICTLKIKI